MNYSFEDCISPIIETAIKVEIPEAFQQSITDFVKLSIKPKKNEDHHKNDHQKELKRFTTERLGWAALEILFNNIMINVWRDFERDSSFVIPGTNVGIKTVEYGEFPIISKDNHYPQIICVTDPHKHGTVYVCGLATVDVLNAYQSDSLVLDPRLKDQGTKTGFYGFEHLVHVSTMDDLEPYREEFKPIKRIKKYCRVCKKPMTVRDGPYGRFWGCTGYICGCTYTEPLK